MPTIEVQNTQELIHVPLLVTAMGDTTIHTPPVGGRIRLRWIYAVGEPTATTAPVIRVFLGADELYCVYALSKMQTKTGAIDAPLVVNLSAASPVAVTAILEEI